MEITLRNKFTESGIHSDLQCSHKKFRTLNKFKYSMAEEEGRCTNGADVELEDEFIDVEGYTSDEAEQPTAKRKYPPVFRPWESNNSTTKKSTLATSPQAQLNQNTPVEHIINSLWLQSTPGMYSSYYSTSFHPKPAQLQSNLRSALSSLTSNTKSAHQPSNLSYVPFHTYGGIQQATPYLTPPASPALPIQLLRVPHISPLLEQRRGAFLSAAPVAQSATQTAKESAQKRSRKPRSSRIGSHSSIEMISELLQLVHTKSPVNFETLLPYQPNMARKFPKKDLTPEEQSLRERNTIACRKSRRKKLLMKLMEQKQQCQTNSAHYSKKMEK